MSPTWGLHCKNKEGKISWETESLLIAALDRNKRTKDNIYNTLQNKKEDIEKFAESLH